jgi:hypothetical protein
MKLTPAERGRWKFRLGSLGLGVLAAGAVFGASLAVSDDLRLMYLVGVIVLFCAATWMGAKSGRDRLSACLLYLPLAGMFGFFVLGQLPFPMAASVVMGPRDCDRIVSGGCPAEPQGHESQASSSCSPSRPGYCMTYIPDRMKRATNHFGDGAAPEFAFQAVSEGAVPTTATPGKILLIDFFGTWCPP